jgi:hypothetical protein
MTRVPALLLAGLLCLVAPPSAGAGDEADTDPALADLIESLARRDVEGIVQRPRPDGSVELELDGRFQQLPIARLGSDGEIHVGCVGTLDEAQRFLGRDLRSGKALPASVSGPAPDDLASRAARHGLTPMQQRFYESLVEQAARVQRPKAATITIVNGDAAGEGFNDATAATPEGGNTGTTRGQQRLILFNQAAAIWGAFLDSPVAIAVNSQFNPLTPCTSSGGVLGAAGPTSAFVLTGGIAGTGTVFPIAISNKLIGNDGNGAGAEINATFNSDVDTGCLGAGTRFYYGLDNATPPGRTNLLVVLLHELGHGLGSLSFTAENGAFLGSTPDIWARYQLDRSVGLLWTQMNDAQRAASSINPNNVLWNGANVRIASGFLTTARDADGRVEMFTPNPFQGGSSVSHWNSTASPNLLMEPAINVGLPLDLDLTRQQMRDIGWFRDSDNNGSEDTITAVAPSGGTLATGAATTITWSNNGGFNRNVTIELSTDGGTTFPTVIASNVANSGSRAWTVPNTPTTQARIRVREHDFVAPSGVSAGNFTIAANTAPTFTPAAAVARQQGSAAGPAVSIGTAADAQTAAGGLTVTQVAGGTATGITVGGITNTNGAITATLAASCSATAGTVRFQASDGSLGGSGDLQVNVSANTAPVLAYAAQSGNAAGTLTVNPSSGPGDNGSIASTTLQSQGTYTGTISVGASNGVVSLSNLGPIGVHTITVRATDNCGTTTDASFQLTVNAVNTAPTFTPAAALTRQQGSPSPGPVAIGTVADAQSPANSLTVTRIAGGTATGVQVVLIANSGGSVSGQVVAECAATSGTVRLQASDGALTGTGDLQVNVLANTPPAIAYAPQTVNAGGALTINPTSISDNGPLVLTSIASAGTYTGTVSIGATGGVLSLSNASPAGVHTITVRATDTCGTTTEASFQLTVNAVNTAPTFTPAAAVARQQGSAAGAAVSIGSAADAQTAAGALVVTQIAGGTATGITVGGITNTNGAITATLAASCSATAGTVRFQASDGSLSGSGDLQVNVQANTPPSLGYAAQALNLGGSLAIVPTTGPADNGAVVATTLLNQGTYTGTATVGAASGVISLSNASPIGLHTITVRAADNCDATTDATAAIQVNGDALFANGFEPVAPTTD